MTSNIAGFPLLAAEHKLNTLQTWVSDTESEKLTDKIRTTIADMRENQCDINDAFNVVQAVSALEQYIKTGEHRYVAIVNTLCTPCHVIKEEYLTLVQGVA